MKTYTIYHIPGKKIGCTDDVKRRMRAQKCKDYEIIEVHTDEDVASDREIELQKQYGYRVDRVKYNEVDRVESGKKAGKIAVESGQLNSIRTKENQWKGINKMIETCSICISVYSKATNEYIGTYTSQNECARQLNLFVQNISKCLKGKLKSTGGYTFRKENK